MRFVRRNLLCRAAVILGLAGVGTVAGVGIPAALAATGPGSSNTTVPTAGGGTLDGIKTKAAEAISIRVGALQTAISAVNANRYLTSPDRSAALAILDSDLSGLTALAPVVQADTTVSKAAADYRSVFTQYRVFALALPQSRFAAAADALTGTVLPRLSDAQSKLQGLLAGPDSAKNTPAVQAAMADLAHRISAITSATSGLSPTVLGYTPAEWNANHDLLSQARANLLGARTDARTARSDIRTIVAALK